jgi:hypothetical protein
MSLGNRRAGTFLEHPRGFECNGLVSTIEAAARSYDLFASCGRAKERDTTKTDLLFLPWKLADHFAATIKELQD